MKVRGTATLGASQALALAAAVGAAAVYAAWLDMAQLALWAMALGAGRAAMLLVDGGLKAALVRHPQGLSAEADARLTRGVLLAALALSVATVLGAAVLVQRGRVESAAATLVVAAILAYLLSHAAALTALVRLERGGRFDHVGRVEGAATVLEFALPALMMAAGAGWLGALLAGVVLGRGARALGISLAARGIGAVPDLTLAQAPWRDGLAHQAIAALGLVRDQIHLWLVGPLYGASWAGAYAFALLACALASQVLVATASRIAVPSLRPLGPRRRALRAARSLRVLALWTLPLLLLAWPALQAADSAWWSGRWELALALLPGLLLRMAVGLPLAVLGPWVAVALSPRAAAGVHARWTAVELVLAAAALAWLGPPGLAVAWALGGGIGTLLFLHALRPHGARWFLADLLRLRASERRRWSMSTCC